MEILRHWQYLTHNQNHVELVCNDEHLLSIYILDEHLCRVWFQRHRQTTLSRTWLLIPSDESSFSGHLRRDTTLFPCPGFELIQQDDQLVITTQKLRLTVHHPLSLSWERKTNDGSWVIVATDRPTEAYQLGRSRSDIAHFMQRDNHDCYYGLGEKTGTVNRYGKRYQMRNLDALGYEAEHGDPLYKHWPFFQVKTANQSHYGLFYDNLSTTWFDLGNERDNYHGQYRSYRAEAGDIDYYFFIAESVKAVTQQFIRLTGRHAFPPKWSLGYSGSTMHYTDAPDAARQLKQFITLCRKHRIPCDSFQLSSGYTSIGDKRYVFHWNHEKIPDPEALTQYFHKAGLKLAANIKPCLLTDHPHYQMLADKGLFIKDAKTQQPERSMFWDAEGSHLDFTNPETIRWWQTSVRQALLEKGIDSTWNDNNEYEIWDDEAQCQGFGESIPIKLIRPLMPLLMTQASYQAQQQFAPQLRPYLISRSGCPGIQRYAQTWSGDNLTSWHTLKWNIRTGIGMSLSGLYNVGHDIGGFAGKQPDAELFVRWIQSALLLPRFTIHSWNDDGTVNEPWMHPEVIDIIRDNLALRYRLIPYLYTLSWLATTADEPIIRPTFLDHGDDDKTFGDSDDYMIGTSLLVTPVTAPEQRQKRIYLPDNHVGWYDYYTQKYYDGGQTIEIDTPLARLPLWVRAGSIIPESELLHADSPNDDNYRYLHVFPLPYGRRTGVIFDDDGISYNYQKGDYYQLNYTIDCDASTINITIHKQGDYQPAYAQAIDIQLPVDESRQLMVNGQPFTAELYEF